VLSLQINADFSNAAIVKTGFTSLIYTEAGKALSGKTVGQILALANDVLGGNTAALPSGVQVSDLNDLVDNLNKSFDNCVRSDWATQHLSLPPV
jgi:hypothetical protein